MRANKDLPLVTVEIRSFFGVSMAFTALGRVFAKRGASWRLIALNFMAFLVHSRCGALDYSPSAYPSNKLHHRRYSQPGRAPPGLPPSPTGKAGLPCRSGPCFGPRVKRPPSGGTPPRPPEANRPGKRRWAWGWAQFGPRPGPPLSVQIGRAACREQVGSSALG